MAQFLSKPFGMTPNGEKINEYIISNPGGLAVSVLNYGCIIKNIWVPTKSGPVDVVLGHDTYADYVKDFESSGSTCCGAFVGRYANRIENAVFNVGGKTYQLEANNGKNHLHGKILKIVIQDGKGIEINTSSRRYGLKDSTPSRDILKLYKELGGKIITIGSDSHKIEHLGAYIDEAKELLKEIGFDSFCTFEKMKPSFHQL